MSRYIRKNIVSLEDGLRIISTSREEKSHIGFRTGGLRLRTFSQKGTCCVYCGLQATYFAIEKCKGSKLDIHHMNLWGVRDGKEVLFTHDHVHARSLGGADDINNSVTACENCNSKKSKYENRLLTELKNLKVSVDFDGLVGIVKSLYKDSHIRRFWFINETA